MSGSVPTYSLYGEAARNDADFWLHCETIASRSGKYRWEIGEHRHENFQQFLYIRDGSGDARLGPSLCPLTPPCVVAVPPGLRHGFRFSTDVDGLVVTFLAGRLPRLSQWLTAAEVIKLPEDDDGRFVHAAFDRLSAESQEHRNGRSVLIEACLSSIIVILGRLVTGSRDVAGTISAPERVRALSELVGQHYRRHLPVTAYARMLNLSPTHLNRLTRDVAGMSVRDLIASRLMDEARRDLVFSSASIKAIADDLGFTDAAYFSRSFARHTGMTPGEYRRAEWQKLETTTTARNQAAEKPSFTSHVNL